MLHYDAKRYAAHYGLDVEKVNTDDYDIIKIDPNGSDEMYNLLLVPASVAERYKKHLADMTDVSLLPFMQKSEYYSEKASLFLDLSIWQTSKNVAEMKLLYGYDSDEFGYEDFK